MSSEALHIILLVADIIAACYLLNIGLFTFGIVMLRSAKQPCRAVEKTVSILVAARNEEKHIEALINSLCSQNYPASRMEIIIIDDHSTDSTFEKAQEAILNHNNYSIKLVRANGKGKKAAVSQALHLAANEIILVTDADSQQPCSWTGTMVAGFDDRQTKMVLGPVVLSPASNLFEKLQVLEHLSLIGSTAGAVAVHLPVMCNGANMAYLRADALAAEEERHDKDIASGDDVFLMDSFVKRFGAKSIRFAYSEKAIVKTQPAHNLRDFVAQRTRWVSKAKSYKSLRIIICALVVGLFSLTILGAFAAAFFEPVFWAFFILLLLLKTFIDIPILHFTSEFLGQHKLMWWVLPLEIIYPFYVVFTSVVGLCGRTQWKGRKI